MLSLMMGNKITQSKSKRFRGCALRVSKASSHCHCTKWATDSTRRTRQGWSQENSICKMMTNVSGWQEGNVRNANNSVGVWGGYLVLSSLTDSRVQCVGSMSITGSFLLQGMWVRSQHEPVAAVNSTVCGNQVGFRKPTKSMERSF